MPRRDDESLEDLPRPVFTHPRRVSVELHDHLRRLIIETQLAPGQVLKQAQLARVFGVSRTPMREAFRMLQEEGLIDADPNQRPRVRLLDVDEVDQLYSVRVLLESFGTRLTAGRLQEPEVVAAQERLAAMDVAWAAGDMDEWAAEHRAFHRVCVARVDAVLMRMIDGLSERTERFLRIYQLWHPQAYAVAHGDHERILESLMLGDRDGAGSRMAQHLARTGAGVMADISPDVEPLAIQEAVALASALVHPWPPDVFPVPTSV